MFNPSVSAVPILMYHDVAAPCGPRRWRDLYVTPRTFARQMTWLRRLGYTGLSMTDAMPYLRGEARGRVAVLTFDDGYADNVLNALPILQNFGFSATCYVVSGALGRHNLWDCSKLEVRKPVMTAEQLRAWRDGGMEVGAHTRTHPRLAQCSDLQLQEEIAGSKADLEAVLGAPVTQFCYPYGDHDERVVAAVRAAGYVAATTTRRGHARPGADPCRLPRIAVKHHHRLPQFAWHVFVPHQERRK